MPLTSPRVVLPVALLAAAIAAISGRRTWLRGEVADAVLGSATVTAAGTQVVPGLVAIALVVAAAVHAAATAGPLTRRVCLALGAGAAALLAVLSVRVATSAESLLGGIAAEQTSRTGTIPVTGVSISFWPWLIAALALLAAVAAIGGFVGAAGWRGLSQRYDAPADQATGSRGERTAGAWDELDRDIDPTAR